MIFGMTIFTFVHVALSLVGIGSGLVVLVGLLAQDGSTAGLRSFWRPQS
jgi:hypothetical protein